ncbi:hypothetical protein SISNIDRAFT_491029 [Sistotremastrum niveocremeum HHB9708]|uniref:Uncharacterized protein n=1 Tax=Sistotremastrum niveocremeum HHB9708 TaxID=1314777 RepID=A0A164N8N4_9AGAM|nr:hypothetical protein SISNIDRAFT_491029 [Sistotremastrum niveocremeum HHB9708]
MSSSSSSNSAPAQNGAVLVRIYLFVFYITAAVYSPAIGTPTVGDFVPTPHDSSAMDVDDADETVAAAGVSDMMDVDAGHAQEFMDAIGQEGVEEDVMDVVFETDDEAMDMEVGEVVDLADRMVVDE